MKSVSLIVRTSFNAKIIFYLYLYNYVIRIIYFGADPCPGNFTRIAHACYHFSERQYNWKSAMSMCKSLGGNLLEFDNKDEQFDVLTYLIGDKYLRGY